MYVLTRYSFLSLFKFLFSLIINRETNMHSQNKGFVFFLKLFWFPNNVLMRYETSQVDLPPPLIWSAVPHLFSPESPYAHSHVCPYEISRVRPQYTCQVSSRRVSAISRCVARCLSVWHDYPLSCVTHSSPTAATSRPCPTPISTTICQSHCLLQDR